MKKIFVFLSFVLIVFISNCNAQPRSDYEIYSSPVTGATKYHFFLEKKTSNPYVLKSGIDYLVTGATFKVGEATTPSFTINLPNDGAEYTVGIVAENSAGYYSGMGTFIGSVGTAPVTPAGIGFRRK